MGQGRCSGDHEFITRELGAGLRRMECGNCGSVVIDLDAAGDGATVTVPGLFKPAKPTIFSVLREEQEAAAVGVGEEVGRSLSGRRVGR